LKIVKTVLLKVYEPNKEKKEALDRTLSLYAEVLKFYLEVIKKAGIYRVVSLRKNKHSRFLKAKQFQQKLLLTPYKFKPEGNRLTVEKFTVEEKFVFS